MNKSFIASYLKGKSKYSMEQRKLISDIQSAREELQTYRLCFNEVKDPKLVDYVIYMERAAASRYAYLLDEAKKLNLKVQGEETLEQVESI